MGINIINGKEEITSSEIRLTTTEETINGLYDVQCKRIDLTSTFQIAFTAPTIQNITDGIDVRTTYRYSIINNLLIGTGLLRIKFTSAMSTLVDAFDFSSGAGGHGGTRFDLLQPIPYPTGVTPKLTAAPNGEINPTPTGSFTIGDYSYGGRYTVPFTRIQTDGWRFGYEKLIDNNLIIFYDTAQILDGVFGTGDYTVQPFSFTLEIE